MSPGPDGWPFRHQIPIRYHEVDMQRVVYNAHYLAYCDQTMSAWLAGALLWTGMGDDHFDVMLVKAVLEWRGSATFGDLLDVDCGTSRWGRTSFDIAYRGSVAGRPVLDATITYVCVDPTSLEKIPVPADVRASLGTAPGADAAS